jgi:translation elongation factor EF-Tu-like GTPase
MAVHGVAEGHAILQQEELLRLNDAQLKLRVVETLHIDEEVTVLTGLVNEGMVEVTSSLSASLIRHLALIL